MKLITILVNNRVDHIVNFDRNTEIANSYIIENTGGSVKLFGFYREERRRKNDAGIIYQTDDGEHELFLKGLSVENKGSSDGVENLAMALYFDDADSSSSQNLEGIINKIEPAYWEEEHSYVSFDAQTGKCFHIDVEFRIYDKKTGKMLSEKMVLNIAPCENIYDIVLDYGSEASQMLIHCRADEVTTLQDIVPLFDLFGTSFGECDKIKKDDYLQYDPDDDNFFRSVFFAKRNLSPSESGNPYGDFVENQDFKLFCKVDDLDSIRHGYIAIPNLKLARYGGVRNIPKIRINGIQGNIFDYKDNYFYRSIVNSFMYQALRKINPAHDNIQRYVNLFLLMPNVYSQKMVTKNLAYACKDMTEMAEKTAGFGYLKGVEVSSVSESDASFLGFMSQLPLNRKASMREGRYLILDAGKGTLDFSVIDYKLRNDSGREKIVYDNIFRSGIIGAGNAITYSFAISILKDIYVSKWKNDEDTIEKAITVFIKSNIVSPSADEAELNKLVKNLERYKILYNEGCLVKQKFPLDLNLKSFDEFSIEAFNNCINRFIESRYLIADDSYIVNMIDTLALDVANKLKGSYGYDKNQRIDYVVFAGRGFQMKKLRDCVWECIKSIGESIISQNLKVEPLVCDGNGASGATYKNLCLFIAHPLLAGRYNGKTIGMPRLIDGNKGPSVTEVFEKKDGKLSDFFKRRIPQIKNIVSMLFPGDLDDKDDELYGNKLNGKRNNSLNKEMVKGIPFYPSKGSGVAFSGFNYEIPDGLLSDVQAEIFFNGAEFEIRQDGNTYFWRGYVNLDGQHVFESTFPYCYIDEVRFPRRPDVNPTQGEEHHIAPDSTYGSEDEKFLKSLNS